MALRGKDFSVEKEDKSITHQTCFEKLNSQQQ